MFAKVAKWWDEKKMYFGVLFGIGSILGTIVAIYNFGKIWSDLAHQHTVEWTTATISVKSIDNELTPDELKTLQGYGVMTLISLPNMTPFKLHSIVVQAPRVGYAAIVDGKGKKEFSKFEGRLDCPDIPPESGLAITLWYDKPPVDGEQLSVSSEETGKLSFPFQSKIECVSPNYKLGFWAAIAILLAKIGWDVLRWMRSPSGPGIDIPNVEQLPPAPPPPAPAAPEVQPPAVAAKQIGGRRKKWKNR